MRQRQPVSELRITGVGDFFQPLQSLCDALGDGLVIGDHEGRILLFNQAARRMIGLQPGATLPPHWWDLDIFYLPDKVTRYPSSDRPPARALRGERDNLE
ncbi:MAG TPA: PAS domain-containing protein, partial [Stenomitos sp.]